jgi:hypothetical protein
MSIHLKSKSSRKLSRWDTFISHASKDLATVRALIELLKSKRLKPWIDDGGVQFGDLLRDNLQSAIRESRTFVLVWSKAAAESRWVIAELLTAFHMGRFIIPCVLDATPLPQFLQNLAYLDRKRDRAQLAEKLAAAIRGAPGKRNKITPLLASDRSEVRNEYVPIAIEQRRELQALGNGNIDLSRKIHAALDKSVRAAVRRFPLEAKILNVAGYHQKNAYMLNHWDAIQAGRAPPDPLLQKSEHYFFASLQANPLDPSALNGIGSILLFERELDAAEFFQRRALEAAAKEGYEYPEAQQDLDLTLRYKHGARLSA